MPSRPREEINKSNVLQAIHLTFEGSRLDHVDDFLFYRSLGPIDAMVSRSRHIPCPRGGRAEPVSLRHMSYVLNLSWAFFTLVVRKEDGLNTTVV
jgi:hypothetical protein